MWKLTGKVEDSSKPIDEAFFDRFKKNQEPDITIKLSKGNIKNVISDGNWMCSGYNNDTVKTNKDLTDDRIAGFIQHTITQQLINYYGDSRKSLPKEIDACAFISKDVERAVKAAPGTYTNNFTFFIFFRPVPTLSEDEMNEFWKSSGYSLYPTSALFEIANENVVMDQSAVPIIPVDKLDEATKLTKEQKKEIVKDSMKYAAFGIFADDNIDRYVQTGKNKSMAEMQIRSAMKAKGKFKEANIKALDKHFSKLRNTTLSKPDGYDNRLKELETYYNKLKDSGN